MKLTISRRFFQQLKTFIEYLKPADQIFLLKSSQGLRKLSSLKQSRQLSQALPKVEHSVHLVRLSQTHRGVPYFVAILTGPVLLYSFAPAYQVCLADSEALVTAGIEVHRIDQDGNNV
jgi:hypothetical protein